MRQQKRLPHYFVLLLSQPESIGSSKFLCLPPIIRGVLCWVDTRILKIRCFLAEIEAKQNHAGDIFAASHFTMKLEELLGLQEYHWGEIVSVMAEYTPIAFSDHLVHTVKVKVPDPLARLLSPTNRPIFKIREEVALDKEFQERVKLAMIMWEDIRLVGLPVLPWWEIIVKPGIRKITMARSKQIKIKEKSLIFSCFDRHILPRKSS